MGAHVLHPVLLRLLFCFLRCCFSVHICRGKCKRTPADSDSGSDSDSDRESDSDSDSGSDCEPVAKKNTQCIPTAGSDFLAFFGTLSHKQYATLLARAGLLQWLDWP